MKNYWELCRQHQEVYASRPLKLMQYPRRYERVIECIRQMHWKVKMILEIGCLTGYGITLLENRGYEIYGIDVSKLALEKRENPNVIMASAEHLPFKDGAFDLVFSVALLEHLHEAGVELFLKEFMRVGTYNFHSPALQCGYSSEWHPNIKPLEYWLDKLHNLNANLEKWKIEDIVWAN